MNRKIVKKIIHFGNDCYYLSCFPLDLKKSQVMLKRLRHEKQQREEHRHPLAARWPGSCCRLRPREKHSSAG